MKRTTTTARPSLVARASVLVVACLVGVKHSVLGGQVEDPIHHQYHPLHSRQHYEAAFYDWMQRHEVTIPRGPDYVTRLNNFIRNR